MARGQPDFGQYAPKTVAASVSDMGEIATRLGSIDVYDKRGDVVFIDDFEDPVLKWTVDPELADSYGRLDSTNPKFGSQCLKVHNADGDGKGTELWKYLQVLASKRLGVEIAFSRLPTALELWLTCKYYDGTYKYEATVSFDTSSRVLAIMQTGGAFTPIATLGAHADVEYMFYIMKLVADFDTKKYVRLLMGPTEYDLSSYDIRTEESEVTPRVRFYLWLGNRGVSGGDCYLDGFIFTQEEP